MKKRNTILVLIGIFVECFTMLCSQVSGIEMTQVKGNTPQLVKTTPSRSRAITRDLSISTIIADADKTKTILIPSPTGEAYKEYESTEAGVKQALLELYQKADQADYVLYFGTNITFSANTLAKTNPETPDTNTITFYALQNKINSLTFTAQSDDPINLNQSAPTGAKTITFPTNAYFGSHVYFRNMSYRGTTFYLNGHNYTSNGGAYGNGLTIYGGTDSGDITGNPTLTINTTGSGSWNYYGGNNNGGTLIGNSTIVVNQTNGNISGIYGGARIGTVDGNVTTKIFNLNGTLGAYYGGGYGTNASNPANVTGKVTSEFNIEEFKLPTGTYITGGRPFNVNTNLGSTDKNTITMNIFTKPGVDSLNGATIYGDGGGNSGTNTKSGSIKMNIQATGSSIGTLYATQYSNIVNGRILRSVEANIQGASKINGLSGGNASDDFTNTIVANSSNQVIYNFGNNIDNTDSYQTDPINITGIGIVNFNELNITNGIKLFANGGNISNGRSASAANHSTTYNNFGSVSLSKNAGLGIANTSNLFSLGKLTVKDEETIEAPQGTGKINLSDFETPNLETDRLTWIKNTTDTTSLLDITGTYFGKLKGYQVLTINPTKENASKVGPRNFKGIEKASGKTYIGDNDITGAVNGYGIAIPGSIIDYQVTNPGIAEGIGSIFHDVTQVKANNEPLTLQAWGQKSQKLECKKVG